MEEEKRLIQLTVLDSATLQVSCCPGMGEALSSGVCAPECCACVHEEEEDTKGQRRQPKQFNSLCLWMVICAQNGAAPQLRMS